ncbi:MAG: toll/interleukin-1 receptor domain-containing protein [Oscillospiraceae bacterium]|nr:toll/interleukin-1 receptor domain-containing protein [Oscillospiraceae bacterium]
MNNEFDKASQVYENIISEVSDEAEAYWGLCLCRYGIEYVVDPKSQKRIPTCHRTQFKSIFDDADYIKAINCCDPVALNVYKAEAEYINGVQKRILEISSKEEPFDVFICYKETDAAGNRTVDSIIAQDIYENLMEKGYKVFFSRITLEDKLGSAYEPYIFAALNSARIMLVIGTKSEYFNAVWVKNEWSRYLSLIEQGQKKVVIPCYRDMSPYDMPEKFISFQSQDVSKIGYMQDLLRGVQKILGKGKTETFLQQTVVTKENANISSLLKRVFLFLEDGDWKKANEYCERVLDIDPECAEAYLGKLMAELNVEKKEKLPLIEKDFSRLDNFKKAVRFGDTELDDLNKQSIYNSAFTAMKKAKNDADFRSAKSIFLALKDFSDAALKAEECEEKSLEYLYQLAISDMILANSDQDFRNVAINFKEIAEYKDSRQRAEECEKKALEYLYQLAINDMIQANNDRAFRDAAVIFKEIAEYKDSRQKAKECEEEALEYLYQLATNSMIHANDKDFRNAAVIFKEIAEYKDSRQKAEECEEKALEYLYQHAIIEMKKAKKAVSFKHAAKCFGELHGYKDSEQKEQKCIKKARAQEKRRQIKYIIELVLYLGVIIFIFFNRARIAESFNDSSTLVLAIINAIVGFLFWSLMWNDDAVDGEIIGGILLIYMVLGVISLMALLLAFSGGLYGALSHIFKTVVIIIIMIICHVVVCFVSYFIATNKK